MCLLLISSASGHVLAVFLLFCQRWHWSSSLGFLPSRQIWLGRLCVLTCHQPGPALATAVGSTQGAGHKVGAIRGGGILSAMAQMLKNLPATQETWVWALGQEDPLEEEMATHSNILPGRIPWTQEPSGYSPWGCRVGHDWATKHSTAYAEHCRWGIPCSFRTSFLSEVSWIRVPSMPWGGYLPSPSLPASQSCSPCFRTPDVGKEKRASLAASRVDWEATCHPQALTFPERNCRMRSLLALIWVPLGVGWCMSSEAAPLALSEHPNSVLGSKGRLKRLFWKPGLLKGSLVCGWLL